MFCILINSILAADISQELDPSLQPEIVLYETQSKRKPFDMSFKNMYNISYNNDTQDVQQLVLALDHTFGLSIDVRTQFAQRLKLTLGSFEKFILLSLISLCKSGSIQATDVLLNHIRDYVNEDDWTCAHLCQIKTHLESMRDGAGYQFSVQSEAVFDLDACLGSVYLDTLLKQQGKEVNDINRKRLFQELTNEMKLYVRDAMIFVELFYPKRVTNTVKAQIHAMQKQRKTLQEISSTVGLSRQTVEKYFVSEESFTDLFSSLWTRKRAAQPPVNAADEICLLADESQQSLVTGAYRSDGAVPKAKRE